MVTTERLTAIVAASHGACQASVEAYPRTNLAKAAHPVREAAFHLHYLALVELEKAQEAAGISPTGWEPPSQGG